VVEALWLYSEDRPDSGHGGIFSRLLEHAVCITAVVCNVDTHNKISGEKKHTQRHTKPKTPQLQQRYLSTVTYYAKPAQRETQAYSQ
jgi:hypothetical protein